MANNWVDVSIQTQIDAGELLGILDDPAVQGAWEEAGVVHLYWAEDQWNGDRLVILQQLLSRLNRTENNQIQVSVNLVPAQDWNQQWARSVKPLRIGRLVIRPSWESVELQPDEREIILDPKQAFGTGHHATTRMLLEWLQNKIRGGEMLLDVGAGSGILAMAALRFGAASAIGVECDPVAVDCARDYQQENGFGPELELICGTLADVDRGVRPDLVLANLDRQTLLALVDDLAAYGMAGAQLIFSGLLADQEAEVVAAYSRRGLYLVDRREQDGWVALELGCSESCEGGV